MVFCLLKVVFGLMVFCFTQEVFVLSFYDRSAPIYTQPRFLPPSKVVDADVTDSVIGEGCLIKVIIIQQNAIWYNVHFIKQMFGGQNNTMLCNILSIQK